MARQISQQAEDKVSERISRFNQNLRVSGQAGKISPQAAERMSKFLHSIDRVAKRAPGKGKPIEVDSQAASQASSVARSYLSQELASEFDLTELQGRVLDDQQINEGIEGRFQEIYEMRSRNGEVDPKPKGSGTPDPLIEDAKKFVQERWEDIKRAGQCIIHGEWKTHWWGWECGISQDCAQLVGGMLTGFGFKGAQVVMSAIREAIWELIKSGIWGGVTLSLEGISGVLVIVQLYAFALGVLILLVNRPSGVWIQGNWPWPIPGLSTPYVWAIPR